MKPVGEPRGIVVMKCVLITSFSTFFNTRLCVTALKYLQPSRLRESCLRKISNKPTFGRVHLSLVLFLFGVADKSGSNKKQRLHFFVTAMQCVTVWVIHFGDKLRSRQTLKGSTPFSILLSFHIAKFLMLFWAWRRGAVWGWTCVQLQLYVILAASILLAGLITRPLYEVRSRKETERKRERDVWERHQVYGFSGDMHKYKGLVSTIYLCANDLQRNGHYIIHWLSSVRMDSLFLF